MTDLIKMWHGGKFDEYEEISIKHSRSGRTYNGPGIYTTNDLNTASDYAKGGRSIYYLGLDPSMNLLEKNNIKYEDVVNFVKDSSGLRKKKEILVDLERNQERTNLVNENGERLINANVLLNLMVNYDVCKGEHGTNLANFYADRKIDASIMKGVNSGEEWLLIFNPKIIKEKRVFSKKELSQNWNSWSFDSPTKQITEKEISKINDEINKEIKIKDLPKGIKEDLFNNYIAYTNSSAIQRTFDLVSLPVKTIDLTKIKESDLYQMSNYDADKYIDAIKKEPNLALGVIADGKLVDGMHRITSLIKTGVKEMKVVDASKIFKMEFIESITDVVLKEEEKNKIKSKIKKAL